MTRHELYVATGHRAWKIVDRVLPDYATPHGWHDTAGFIASCQHRSRRNHLYKAIFWKLIAKADALQAKVERDLAFTQELQRKDAA